MKPLTLAELIHQFDVGTMKEGNIVGGLSLGFDNGNDVDGDRRALRHFTSISSDFYPQLEEHYERVFEDWAALCW